MRAVIDTNVLLRAFIKPDGTVGPVLSRLALGQYTLVYSDYLIDELLEKLALPRISLKYHIDSNVIEAFLQLLVVRGDRVAPTRKVALCRDPDDDRVIEAALAGHVDFIVTTDSDLLVLNAIEGIPVIIPSVFLRHLDNLTGH